MRSSLRHYLSRDRFHLVLSIAGVTLGVALLTGIELATSSASREFQESLRQITGRSTHQIRSTAGPVSEGIYRDLRLAGVRRIAPVIEGRVRVGGVTATILGIDIFAESTFRNFTGGSADFDERDLLQPQTALLSLDISRRLALEPGDTFETETLLGDSTRIRIVGLLPGTAAGGPDNLLVADLATAQTLLNRLGELDRIDVGTQDTVELATIRSQLRSEILVETDVRSNALLQLTRAHDINLFAMGLLGLLVAGFLIFNSITLSVLKRHTNISVLRGLGVTRAAVFAMVAAEAACIGLGGSALGVPLGYVLSDKLLDLLQGAPGEAYFATGQARIHLSGWVLLETAGLGVLLAMAAAILPALYASRIPPALLGSRARLEHSARRLAWPLAIAGLTLLMAGVVLNALSSQDLLLGYAGLLMKLLGYTLVIPLALLGFSCLLRPILAHFTGVIGELSARNLAAHLSRNVVAVAALTVAMATTLGFEIMLTSFRGSVEQWVERTMEAELYVLAPQQNVDWRLTLPGDIRDRLAAIEGVAATSAGRWVPVEHASGPTRILALDLPEGLKGFEFVDGQADFQSFQSRALVLVSEPLAYRFGLVIGDSLELVTRSGSHAFDVQGVFRDYRTEQGFIAMSLAQYRRWWDDDSIGSVGLFLAPGSSLAAVQDDVRSVVAKYSQPIVTRATQEIRRLTLRVFDQTFLITELLRQLIIVIAILGVIGALMALSVDSAREHAILRVLGLTPWQLFRFVCAHSMLLGIAAGLLALPLGAIVATDLIDVINLRSFGWGMEMVIPWTALILTFASAVAASLVAALIPARQHAKALPVAALHYE
jgi:putative ABC transport system permease protein